MRQPMNAYRRNVWELLREAIAALPPLARVLDFGSGDGWLTERLRDEEWARLVVPVDVARRRRRRADPLLFDGGALPFADRAFDLVAAVDVVHHCADPIATLAELTRCSGRYLLLKDHTFRSTVGRLTLCVLDELGNRRFGVPSLYRYQRGWEWLPVLEAGGFECLSLHHPARCETRPPLSWFVNRHQFVGLWQRRRRHPRGSTSPTGARRGRGPRARNRDGG